MSNPLIQNLEGWLFFLDLVHPMKHMTQMQKNQTPYLMLQKTELISYEQIIWKDPSFLLTLSQQLCF